MNVINHTEVQAAVPLRGDWDPAIEQMLTRIRLRAQRRVLWLRSLWQQSGAEEGASLDFHGIVDSILSGNDNTEAEARWYKENDELQHLNARLAEVESEMEADAQARLQRLIYQFGLTPAESDLLQTCLALRLDPSLERVFSYLQDHSGRGYVNPTLVAGLFGHPYGLAADSLHNLRTWELISVQKGNRGEPELYTPDPFIVSWLLGKDLLDEALLAFARFKPAKEPLKDWPTEQAIHYISRLILLHPFQRVRLCIQGLPGSGRSTFAASVARYFGQSLLVANIDRLAPEQMRHVYLRAQRQAYLGGYALAWTGQDLLDFEWPEEVVPVQLQFLLTEESRPAQPVAGVVDFELSLPSLRIDDRKRLWQEMLPGSAEWTSQEQAHLIHRYKVSVGQIAEVARREADSAEEAIEVLRASTRHRLGKLAQVLECPFSWDDLALSEGLRQHLEDFVYEAREREALWERPEARRLFPQGKGLMALFTGSPGTGKTMAAQVIAASLDLDLFRIDLSSVISKYIGETSKHLERILSQARHMHAVLLFDEADTLFGKRTDIKDAHDRYANSDTNYLLQAIENYPGVAILASNKKSNIDTAFIRRLRFVFDFPQPDEMQRLQIWQQIIQELAGKDRLEAMAPSLVNLANRVDLTGAQIKNSILSALFLAQKADAALEMPHLLRGIERELMKEGRRLGPETLRGM